MEGSGEAAFLPGRLLEGAQHPFAAAPPPPLPLLLRLLFSPAQLVGA